MKWLYQERLEKLDPEIRKCFPKTNRDFTLRVIQESGRCEVVTKATIEASFDQRPIFNANGLLDVIKGDEYMAEEKQISYFSKDDKLKLIVSWNT